MADTKTTSALPADIAELLELGAGQMVGTPVFNPDGSQTVFLGEHVKAHTIPALNPVLPAFVTASESFIEPDSFIAYITKFKSATAIVKAQLGTNQMVCALDYHGDARTAAGDGAQPRHNAHKVALSCPWDPDYSKWRGAFDKPIAQEALMEFLEDLIHTIAEPLAGDLLEAVGNVEIDRESKFKSVRNLRNGTVQFVYAEDERTGEVIVPMPEIIKVVVPVFQGGNPQVLEVKLRYGLEKGILFFKLVLPGRQKLEREAFRSIGERVRAETSTPVFYGA